MPFSKLGMLLAIFLQMFFLLLYFSCVLLGSSCMCSGPFGNLPQVCEALFNFYV